MLQAHEYTFFYLVISAISIKILHINQLNSRTFSKMPTYDATWFHKKKIINLFFSASTTTINTVVPSPHKVPIPSPKSRSSSSQQLPVSKARSLYAKQGSANLLLQNSSGLSAPNSHKMANKISVSKQFLEARKSTSRG